MPVDDLRTGPRLVHPRLAPPPLYVKDYEWDAKKKVAKYVGITTVPTSHKPKVKPSQSPPPTPNKSSTALGKRKRAASRSESPASTPRPKKKIVVSRTVELKKVTAGSRSSTRVLAGQGSVSARFRSFEKLKQSMGGGDSDSELSELDESGDEAAEARKIAAAAAGGSRPIIVMHAKAEDSSKTGDDVEMLLNVVKSPDDTEDEHEVAALLLAEPIGSTAPESPLEEVFATPAPVESLVAEKPSAEFGLQSPRPSPRPSSPRADPPPLQPPPGPSDAESQPSASHSNGASAPDNTTNSTNSSGSASAPQFFRDSRSSIGGGAAGGSGGDDGEERKGKKPEKVDEEMRMEVDEVEEETAGEAAVKEDGEENGEDVPASDAPSEGGSKRDSDTREAAAFLLMLKK